jgi:glycosyltransferase involved in cell wall biosynthesis
VEKIKNKILLLSSGDNGGAYEAIYRLGKHFVSQGCQVKILVKNKTKSDDFIIAYSDVTKPYKRKNLFQRFLIKIKKEFTESKVVSKVKYNPNYDFISTNETSINVSANSILNLIGFTPDIIYSGMTDSFMNSTDLLNLQQLAQAQVYNIAVDMNHFTGGCHYAWDCKGYIEGCSSKCPAILDDEERNIPKINFETKLKNAKQGNFKVVGMSQWTINQAKESMIYKQQREYLNVNSLIDTTILNNKCKNFAKQVFNLEEDKFYILMGCHYVNAKRKGFEYLVKALETLFNKLNDNERDKVRVIIVSKENTSDFENILFEKQFILFINDYRLLSLLYQATDVFVNSSIEDAGPMMVSEALACGTPVVGFDMGVVNNMVISGYNGYKAKLKDSEDLANGIKTIFELSPEDYKLYSINAVKQVEQYSSLKAVDKNLNLIP